MKLVDTFLEHFASDGPWNETSSRQGNVAIVTEYTFPIVHILFEHIAFAFEMVPSAEMTFVVARPGRLRLASLSTLVPEFGDGLLHDVNQSGEFL